MKLRVGLIGHGRWGRGLARAILQHPLYELVVVCDTDSQALVDAPAGVFKSTQVSTAVEHGLDALFVAIDPREQGRLAASLLDSGLALFVEKPLAMALPDADQIVRMRRPKQVIFVDHLVQYMPVHQRAQAFLREVAQSQLQAVFALRHGARARPGVAPLWSLGPHDVALLQSLGRGTGEWTAFRDEQGRIVADSTEGGSRANRLWLGAEGPSRRQTFYFWGAQMLWVDEAAAQLRVGPAFPHRVDALFQGRTAEAMNAELSILRQSSEEVAVASPSGAPGQATESDPLQIALTAFAAAVLEGLPVRSGAEEGRAVVAALARIERALPSDR